MSIPFNVQHQIWLHSVKSGETYCEGLKRRYPKVPENIMVLVTTALVRYSHESVLDAIRDRPPQEWVEASPDDEIDKFCGVLLTWVDPVMQKAFDCLSGMIAPQEAHDRAQAYREELLQTFPASTHKGVNDLLVSTGTIDFLVETDRRWWQYNREHLSDRQEVIDRLRQVARQIMQECAEANQQAEEVVEQFKGFAKRAAQSSKRTLN